MNSIKFATLITIFSALATSCFSQDVCYNKIILSVEDVQSSNGSEVEFQGDKLISDHCSKVEWIDSSGNLKFSFNITSAVGSWENIAENGLIHFNFQMEGQPGEVVIQRTAGLLSAEIQLYKVDSNPLTYFLKISGYTAL